ncbi:MAG: Lyase-like protein [Nitrospinaceae bacterium]
MNWKVDGGGWIEGGLSVTLLLAAAVLSAPASAATIEEFVTPAADSSPTDLAFAPDGVLWFTMINANKIGKLEPDRVQPGTSQGITEYPAPRPNSKPHYITVARDGMVWFSEMAGNRITRLDPRTGQFKGFAIPSPRSEPHRLVEDEDGFIWFLEFAANKVGRLDPASGSIREFSVGEGHPHGIAKVGREVWFTLGGKFWAQVFFNRLGVLNLDTGKVRTITVPPAKSVPHGMTATAARTVWFTQMFASKLGRVHPDGRSFDEFLLGPRRGPHGLVVDAKRNRVWFTAGRPDAIGMLDLTRAQPGAGAGVEFFNLPHKGSHPSQIVVGPDGSVWFTEMGLYFRGRYANRIGHLIP